MEQPTLWQDDSQTDEPRAIHLGDMVELGFCWADGDTNPVQLQRLAKVLQGDLTFMQDTQGGYHPFRIRSTWVVEGVGVRGMCEAIRNPMDGKNSFDPAGETVDESEDEEDC